MTTRRRFLQSSTCAALGAAAVGSTLSDLLHVAAAAEAAGDYKALVCLFLYGGNDSNNVVVPTGTAEHAAYTTARGILAIPRASLLPITPATSDGRTWGLHPSLLGVQSLFSQGRLGLVANVGPLVGPLTRAQYLAKSAAVPPQLFSHTDQAVHWQTSLPDRAPTSGWGGRAADFLRALNTGSVSMAISIAGANTFEVGSVVDPYQLSSGGTINLDYYNAAGTSARSRGMNSVLTLDRGNLLENGAKAITRRAIDNNAVVGAAIAPIALTTVFPDTYVGRQLKMIARVIGARATLGFSRQIFFCAAYGYDTHGDQLAPQADLLTELSQALSAFYDATVELGVASSVTTFTASDFGRTYPANELGTDHGWGSHHLVLGGAVKGGDIYGRMPVLAVGGPDDTSLGRWIPTTSVDQYSATLASWFGVAASDMPIVLPNLGRFATPNLGFMM